MGMTIAEKILADHAGRSKVAVGEYLWCRVDGASGIPHELLDRVNLRQLHDPERTFVVEDHLAPPPDVARANKMVRTREAVRKWGVRNFYEYGRHGILHQVFAENGMFAPGELVAMRDSHATSGGVFNACVTSSSTDYALAHAIGENWFRVPPTVKVSLAGNWERRDPFVVGKDVVLKLAMDHGTELARYRSVEVVGPAVRDMSLSSRWTIANMGVEIGAKFCLFECDDKTREFLDRVLDRPYQPVYADEDAQYEREVSLDVEALEPLVACPHELENVHPVAELAREKIRIDQAFIGSCTNGRYEDYEIAARILRGRKVHPDVRLLCSPASQQVWREVLHGGLWEVFADAGANIEHSSCGPCFGGHMGVLGDGEVTISSTNRNFQGRQGSPLARIYLANPAVVAASAVAGYIADPGEYA
jgi:3-isopropylmalate/(R)-2-methylmalate dehydratase large subunit